MGYTWEQVKGTSVTLDDPTSAKPSFLAPNIESDCETLGFQLTVADNKGLKATDTCIVNIGNNTPPVVSVVFDPTVMEGKTVTLDGSGSTDLGDGIASYRWKQIGGLPVTLSDASVVTAKPTFVAPAVNANDSEEARKLTFQLIVTDKGGLEATDEVTMTVVDNGITDFINVIDFKEDVITTTTTTTQSNGVETRSIGIETQGDDQGSITSLYTIDPVTITDDAADKPADMPYGLINIGMKVPDRGRTVEVVIYLSTPAPAGYAWFKYSPTKGWYNFSAHAVFNADRTQVTLTLTDGGDGDDDGVANGVIVDPSGLGKFVPPAPSGGGSGGGDGDGGSGGNCFISIIKRMLMQK